MTYTESARAQLDALQVKDHVRILALETSCDETAAAIIEDGRTIVSYIVFSQIDLHALYGGVVPEIASRAHVEACDRVIDEALRAANMCLQDVDARAVTYGPGLVGALLTGVSCMKGLSYAANKPLIPVNHIEGHVSANYISNPDLKPPFLCLVVSGGHSHIVRVEDYGVYTLLGQPMERMTGRGAGLSDAGLTRKGDAIHRGIVRNQPDPAAPLDVMAKLGVANMDELANQVTVTLKPATETPTATVEVESSVSAFEEGLDETVAATAVTIAEAKAKRAFLEQQLAGAKAKALANITPEADEVLAALAEGQDWDTLAEAHNDDPGMKAGAVNAATGYPVCEGFTQFDAAFVEGAMALQNVGDYSDKIEGSYGYYIIQYTSDVVEGAVDMETVHDTISSSLLSSKQSTVRDEVVAQWVKDANATINKDILND